MSATSPGTDPSGAALAPGSSAPPEVGVLVPLRRGRLYRLDEDPPGVIELRTPPGRDTEAVLLLNARVRLVARLRRQALSGVPDRASHLLLAVRFDDGREREVTVTAEEWTNGAWLDVVNETGGGAAVPTFGSAAGRADLRAAIVDRSGVNVPTVTVWSRPGWVRSALGSWVYADAAGGIGSGGRVLLRTALDADVPVSLGEPCATVEDGRAALAASLCLFGSDLGAALSHLAGAATSAGDPSPLLRVLVPLLGATYFAPAGKMPGAMYLRARYGAGKSSVSGFCLSHYADVSGVQMPNGAGVSSSTAAGLEATLWQGGDSLSVLDDVNPDGGMRAARERASALARAWWDGMGRQRMTKDLTARPRARYSGSLIVSGELGPDSQSAESRVLFLPLRPGDISLSAMKDADRPELRVWRRRLSATVVRWMAGQLDDVRAWAVQGVRDDQDDLGKATGNLRAGEQAAACLGGWRVLMRCAVELGIVDPARASGVLAGVRAILLHVTADNVAAQDSRSTATRVGEALRGALQSGRAHVASRDSAVEPWPTDPSRWGWIRRGGAGPSGEWVPAGRECVGYLGGVPPRLLLTPDTLAAVVAAQSAASGDALGFTPTELGEALLAEQALTGLRPRLAHGKPIPKSNPRILALGTETGSGRGVKVPAYDTAPTFLYPEDEDPAPTPAASAPGGDPWAGREIDPAPADPPMTPAPSTGQAAEQDALLPWPVSSASTAAPEIPHPTRAVHAVAAQVAAVDVTGGAVGVVVDGSAVWAIRSEGGTVELTTRCGELLTLPSLAAVCELLAEMVAGRPVTGEAFQAWLMPAVLSRLRLTAAEPANSLDKRVPSWDLSDPAVLDAREAGWTVKATGPWLTVYRTADRARDQAQRTRTTRYLRVALAGSGWMGRGDHAVVDGCSDDDGRPWAAALSRWCELVQGRGVPVPYWLSPATAGHRLIQVARPAGRRGALGAAVTPCPPALGSGSGVPYLWARPVTDPAERSRAWAHTFDRRSQYLAVAGTDLGTGAAVHHPGPLPFDPKLAAHWLVDPGTPDVSTLVLPDPAGQWGRGVTGPRWMATPAVAYLAGLGVDVAPAEAWIYPGRSRALAPWQVAVTAARAAALAGTDPSDPAVLAGIKALYAGSIGKLRHPGPGPLYRPDWQETITAQARVNMHRVIRTVWERTGRAPFYVGRDTVGYFSDEPNALDDVPAGIEINTQSGKWKPENTQPAALILPLLDAEASPESISHAMKHGRDN